MADISHRRSVHIILGFVVGAGCPVGSMFFKGEPLCVEAPVTLFRVYLGMVTIFGARLCWGGGGNVTFHGIQFPWEYFIIDVSLVPLGHIRMWRVRLSWDSRVTCTRVSEHALYRERRS